MRTPSKYNSTKYCDTGLSGNNNAVPSSITISSSVDLRLVSISEVDRIVSTLTYRSIGFGTIT